MSCFAVLVVRDCFALNDNTRVSINLQCFFNVSLKWSLSQIRHYATTPSVCENAILQDTTSSSAVADRLRDARLRDASCLSIVSFNTTVRRAQSSIIGYFGFRFTVAYN